jgi:hypothetical protein
MTDSERRIDHIVLAVRDLEVARQSFAAFGFTTTPPARHPFGTGNSLIQLGSSFIELLAVVEPEKLVPMADGQFSFGAFNDSFLRDREGMSMLVLSSDDARADNDGWNARGLATYAPVDFSRQATLADGRQVTVAFTIAFAIDPTMPATPFFVCQQHYPENFWQPAYQEHANGGRDIAAITMTVPTPARHADFFGAMVPDATVAADGDALRVQLARGRIDLQPAADAAATPAFSATTVAVDDLDATARVLSVAGVPFEHAPDSLIISPADCFGMTLVFVGPSR